MNTPVLYLIFNRPKETELSFERIRQIRPSILYIAADGPRKEKIGETEKCQKVRAITEKIDWPCEVKRLYREENLGCGKAVSEAITWFFEKEEQGIILEDDILPDLSFFDFCTELLSKYKDDNSIFQIAGFNFFNLKSDQSNSYFFSLTSPIWGWASWRRAWNQYDFQMKDFQNIKSTKDYTSKFSSKQYADFETLRYEEVYGKWFTWDIQWDYTKAINGGKTIVPFVNLVENIGFGADATHTRLEKNPYKIPVSKFHFPIIHPQQFSIDTQADFNAIKINLKFQEEVKFKAKINKYLVSPLMKLGLIK